MYIKEITVNGFKAFAGKESITFSKGICALVGPNGSGKSNIIDAIKWVIGEQRISELRGEKLEDLIFNGSQKFKPQNFAEVNLVFDNSEKKFPIDYDTLAVMRRMYRSGESEFFINRQSCRLRDIQDIFLNSGLGKSSYAIIPQGKIDQILSDKAEEKRKLFEEAASIAKFRERRKEYEAKISKAQENLVRVDDLLKQNYRRRNQLSKQTGDTAKYFDLSEQVKNTQIQILLHELFSSQQSSQSLKAIIDENEKKMQTLQLKLESIKKESESLKSSLSSNTEELNELEKERIKNEQMKNALKQEKTWLEDGVRDTDRVLKNLEENLQRSVEEIEHNQKKIDDNQVKVDLDKQQLHKGKQSILEFKKELSQVVKQVKTLEQERKILNEVLNKKEVERERIAEEQQKILLQLIQEIDTLKQDLEKKNIIATREIFSKKIEALIEAISIIDTGGLDQPEVIAQILEIKNRIALDKDFFKSFFEEEKKFYHFFFSAEGTYSQREKLAGALNSLMDEFLTTRQHLEKNQISVQQEQVREQELTHKIEIEKFNLSGYEQSVTALEADIKEKRVSIHSAKEVTKRMMSEVEFSSKKKKELEEKLRLNSRKYLDFEEENRVLIKRVDGFFQQQKDKREKFELSVKQEAEIEQQLEEIKKKNYQHSAELQVQERDRESLYEKGSYQCSVDLRQYTPSKLEAVGQERRNLQQFQDDLQSLGAVNPLAKEEFDEISVKIEEVESQKNDILASITDLEKVTQETIEEGKKIFLETFQEVNQNFSMLIQELFVGGEGSIRLSDEEDPLEADISIIVQPEGKKFQKLNLFSGGERSLIVLAFIFSFFLRRPSPFCLLDEVDAALDSNNIERFMRLLKKMEKHTQLLLISHNQKTMQIVDYIYGFSMKNGVTKILSLKV